MFDNTSKLLRWSQIFSTTSEPSFLKYVGAKFSQLRRSLVFDTESHTNVSYYFWIKCFVLYWRQDFATTSEPNIYQEFYVRYRSFILSHSQVFPTTLEPSICYYVGARCVLLWWTQVLLPSESQVFATLLGQILYFYVDRIWIIIIILIL